MRFLASASMVFFSPELMGLFLSLAVTSEPSSTSLLFSLIEIGLVLCPQAFLSTCMLNCHARKGARIAVIKINVPRKHKRFDNSPSRADNNKNEHRVITKWPLSGWLLPPSASLPSERNIDDEPKPCLPSRPRRLSFYWTDLQRKAGDMPGLA